MVRGDHDPSPVKCRQPQAKLAINPFSRDCSTSSGVPSMTTLPFFEEADPIAELESVFVRMGDDDAWNTRLPAPSSELAPHLALRPDVDGGEGFVEEEEIGL